MNTEEALAFLRQHQPMPPDEVLSNELAQTYDAVRLHFLEHYDERCVPLFVMSLGDGDGFGVYQLVDEVLARYPKDLVVECLDDALKRASTATQAWALEFAMGFPDPRLTAHAKALVESEDEDLSDWALGYLDLLDETLAPDVVRRLLVTKASDEDATEMLTRMAARLDGGGG